MKRQSPKKLGEEKAEFIKRINDNVPQSVTAIHAVLVGGGGGAGLLEIWAKKTSYDLTPSDDAVSAEWLRRAGLIFAYYLAVECKALALEAERLESYKDDNYNPAEDVKELSVTYKERFLEEINFLPYGRQWGASWQDHLPNTSDVFVDTSTGRVWTTAKAITGEQKVWLGWPDGNNERSAPTLNKPLVVWLQQNNLHLPTLEEFAQAFRAYGPWRAAFLKKHWKDNSNPDVGDFLSSYLGGAFIYKKGDDNFSYDRNIEINDGEPLIPCIWLATPEGGKSIITTSVLIRIPVYQNGQRSLQTFTKKADGLKLEAPIQVRNPDNPNDLSWHARRPERECTIIAFRYKKIDETLAR